MNHLLFVRWMHRRPVDPSNQGTVMAKVFVWHGGRQHIHRGSLLLTLINFIPRMYYNYIQYRVQDETNYPFTNFNGCTVEVWEWIRNFIPWFTGCVLIYPWILCWLWCQALLNISNNGFKRDGLICQTHYEHIFTVTKTILDYIERTVQLFSNRFAKNWTDLHGARF